MFKVTLCYFLMIVAVVMAASIGENEEVLQIKKRNALPPAPPGFKTTTFETKSTTPVTKATTIVTKETTPVTKSTTPVTKATTPVTKVTTPVTKVATIVTKATTPVTKATTIVIKATTLVTKATTPVTKVATIVTKETTPVTKTTTQVTKETTFVTKATTPVTKVATIVTKATTPVTKSATIDQNARTIATKSTPYSKGFTNSVACNEDSFEKAEKCCKVPNMFSLATIQKCIILEKHEAETGKSTKVKRDVKDIDDDEYDEDHRNVTCMLVAEGLLTFTGEIDPAILTSKFKDAAAATMPVDPAWPATFDAALTDCQTKAASAPASADVNQKNQMLMVCLKKTLLETCPKTSINSTVTTCSATLASLVCDPFILPPPAKVAEVTPKVQG